MVYLHYYAFLTRLSVCNVICLRDMEMTTEERKMKRDASSPGPEHIRASPGRAGEQYIYIAITISSCKQSAMSNDTIRQHTADLRSLTVQSA